jgi:hypothetical protein
VALDNRIGLLRARLSRKEPESVPHLPRTPVTVMVTVVATTPHAGRFWHGQWYSYGVGPCWSWSDDYDEYVWVCF